MSTPRRNGPSILGVGVAACLACCAGPLLAFLSGLGLAGLASTLMLGAAGLAITAIAIVAILVVRRQRTNCAVPADDPGAVQAPTRTTTS